MQSVSDGCYKQFIEMAIFRLTVQTKGVGIAQSVSDGLRAGRPGSITGRGKRYFSSPQRPDRLWGPPGSFPGVKAAGVRSSAPTSHQVRGQEWWSYTSTPPYVFLAWCLIN
jgi:hypothetical protein